MNDKLDDAIDSLRRRADDLPPAGLFVYGFATGVIVSMFASWLF